MTRVTAAALLSLCVVLVSTASADGPADNQVDKVRRIPKEGIPVSEAEAASLKEGLTQFEGLLARLRQGVKDPLENARRADLLPDVEVYYKAVHDALVYREFFDPREIPQARELLATGIKRAEQLLEGQAPWTHQTGLVVRGYRSKIDFSVQPYGLVIPATYQFEGNQPVRLDVWFHGRGETLSELSFINQRQRQVGLVAPKDGIVLHPYGRYCNANKFAGEIDTLEALEAVKRHYRIDEDRTVVRGFSMGGAACWQFAVHYADRWAAAGPGAGFSETPDFLKVFQQETLTPTWYEQKLWHWYDCTDWAINLTHCPTVAYSGELDSQKQAADVMDAALKKLNISLTHVIGPGTKHSIHPEAGQEVERRITSIVNKGRDRVPQTVRFHTYTLRYNRMAWVTIDGLVEHWEKGGVYARYNKADNVIQANTDGVTDVTFQFDSGWAPFDVQRPVTIEIDRQKITGPSPASDLSFEARLYRGADGRWTLGARPTEKGTVRKSAGLQGPIDDAFMDTFLFVKPSGKGAQEKVHAWVTAEMNRAIEHWRRHFRGEPLVKLDTEITDADIASANLVLWGDPTSNAVFRRIADQIPIRWESTTIKIGTQEYPADHHGVVAVMPNPLNRKRYVVLNSGFTFRDYDYLNNARQTAKLPDWAVVDVDTPPNSRTPGKIVAADFFGEAWEVRPYKERK